MTRSRLSPRIVARRGPRARGFTLIELLVTISVAGVLLALAAPALQRTLSARAVVSQSSELLDGLRFARAEAIKRSAPVVICRTAGTTPPACAAEGSWRYWMVFADTNNNGSFDSGELPLRVQSSASGAAVLPAAAASAPMALRFQATGIMLSTSAGGAAIELRPNFDAADPAYRRDTRIVCINAQGRATAVDGNGSCS